MHTKAVLSGGEIGSLRLLGERVRLARLRRNLTQAELAERMGVRRLTVVSLEKGRPGVTLATTLKALTVLGYTERLADLLASDPIGEDMEIATGRKRARSRAGVADF
ncbi:helix-turn-helix domain-containing protein [Methylorubrum populi]|uniref:Helix-turn-helix domain-containing protein n=1 Tax=Methylorubrum rhodesianum TaxID=29427 RepID=A0ABU9Z5N6_9HYPH|nr:helix-turn-helix domain-containing protein [Methylorubrum rhodesianum]MBK3405190.1 helix-turn-helix domain-containing protein [Methylorubrum rhodesianum]MBY0138675.1 helix-turn-helix domain-containing protein [Methylorubrum populi]